MDFLKVSCMFLLLKFCCLWPTGDGCISELNREECLFEVSCLNMIENQIELYSFDDYNSGERCRHIYTFGGYPDDGRSYFMLDMKFRGEEENCIFDKMSFSGRRCRITNLIYKLDLSSNSYKSQATLRKMENLSFLNLSRNSLYVAKLSNSYELDNLISLDLSYNVIRNIVVEDEPFKNLQLLNLSNNYLVTIQDAIFDHFPHLLTLDLSHNFIDILGVASFEGLKRLSSLFISHNRLSEIKESLFRFNKLKILDFSHNRLTQLESHDFEKLQELTHLNLSDNSISIIENSVFDKMSSLELLRLDNNSLQDLSRVNLSNAINLVFIDFSNNNIKSLPKEFFKGKNISFFDISGNNLEGSLRKGTFEGLIRVSQLDLSNQQLTAIDDYSFIGLEALTDLMLNKNKIQSISLNGFKKLTTLITLNLSDNSIIDLCFDSTDLINLRVISLNNNFIDKFERECIEGMSSLQLLYLSNNNIPKLNSISFDSLHDLIYLDISSNPLNGTVETGTFKGLHSLPRIDISFTQLQVVKNGSFAGMVALKQLNISHGIISYLEYNSFTLLSTVETIDLSYNRIKILKINGTDLVNLQKLSISHNLLMFISDNIFDGLSSLSKIDLSYNAIKIIQDNSFINHRNLEYLDISFNSDVVFDTSVIRHNKLLNHLHLSGLKHKINFSSLEGSFLFELVLTYTSVTNITALNLKKLQELHILLLNHNTIEKVEQGSFSNMEVVERIDLSYNKILYLQPGVFSDNKYLHTLNVSHNYITTVAYGVLKGLLYLNTLDISYNNISNLESERFSEVQSLEILIADYNNIDYIGTEEFSSSNLKELSIGGNPLPCKVLAVFKESNVPYNITAIDSNDYSKTNYKGITCLNEISLQSQNNKSNFNDYSDILIDIRDTLHNIFAKNLTQGQFISNNNDTQTFERLANQYSKELSSFINHSSKILEEENNNINEIIKGSVNTLLVLFNQSLMAIKEKDDATKETLKESVNNTTILLEKILNTFNGLNSATTPLEASKDNSPVDVNRYINNVKHEMIDIISNEKRNILNEIEKKLNVTLSKNLTAPTITAVQGELVNNNHETDSHPTLFTDICVCLILTILVCLILFKCYKSRMIFQTRRSYSTRELPGAMESPDL